MSDRVWTIGDVADALGEVPIGTPVETDEGYPAVVVGRPDGSGRVLVAMVDGETIGMECVYVDKHGGQVHGVEYEQGTAGRGNYIDLRGALAHAVIGMAIAATAHQREIA